MPSFRVLSFWQKEAQHHDTLNVVNLHKAIYLTHFLDNPKGGVVVKPGAMLFRFQNLSLN
jgi:hypothetical protein